MVCVLKDAAKSTALSSLFWSSEIVLGTFQGYLVYQLTEDLKNTTLNEDQKWGSAFLISTAFFMHWTVRSIALMSGDLHNKMNKKTFLLLTVPLTNISIVNAFFAKSWIENQSYGSASNVILAISSSVGAGIQNYQIMNTQCSQDFQDSQDQQTNINVEAGSS